MSCGYFITGTDTDVGKTVVSTVLAIGLEATYWKPIQTGAELGTDTQFAQQWLATERVQPESYLFSEPVSPHLAAGRTGLEIDLRRCLSDFARILGPVIVEGAGGVLVPLNSSCLMVDLIRGFGLPAIVVARTKLGTINHTLLTLEALKARDVLVAGVVTVGIPNQAVKKSIEDYARVEVLGHVPECAEFSLGWFQETYKQLSVPSLALRSPTCMTI